MIITTESLSENLEDTLWNIGLNSHNMSPQDIKKYINLLKNTDIPPKTVLNGVSYLMHTYFFYMEDLEKKECIDLLLAIDTKNLVNFGDIFDILAILFKKAPNNKKGDIFKYILNNSNKCLSSSSALISICNSFSYIFNELSLEEKMQLIEKLKYLMECNTYNHLRETFEFTLSLFEKDLI